MLNTFQKVKNTKFYISRGKNKRGKRIKSFNSFNFCNFCNFCNFRIVTFVTIATIFTLVTIYTFVTSVVFAGTGIIGTKHDLSSSGTGTIKATAASGVTQKCVFCHTPHSSTKAGPLWNHSLSSATYVVCNPASLCSTTQKSLPALTGPDGSSRLCLGCHDGTVALGLLVNVPGSGMAGTVAMERSGVPITYMPCGPTDFTCLGTDLKGKHLVSIEYDDGLVTEKDNQCASGIQVQGLVAPSTLLTGAVRLRPTTNDNTFTPDTPGAIGARLGIQCRTCHDPHDNTNLKFLVTGSPTNQNPLCETCHYNRSCL